MAERVPAAQLHQISVDDVQQAIRDLKSQAVGHEFGESTRFDLLFEGEHRYPPKAIVGLAARRSFGRVLSPGEFAGGESSAAFRVLWELGFAITTKPSTVGQLDATFSVGRDKDNLFLIVESKGPERNLDYLVGLEALLQSLADLRAALLGASVESRTTRDLPRPERELRLSGHNFPVALGEIADVRSVRLEITSAAAATARTSESTGGGNPTKRLRIDFATPDDYSLIELAEILASGTPVPRSESPRQFAFIPKAPPSRTGERSRKPIDATVVTDLHDRMQDALYERLVAQHGEQKVSSEQDTCSGRPADLVVETDDCYEFYEIKTTRSPRDCVRQALGQLLEYAYWPGSEPSSAIHVVGPSAIDPETQEYLAALRARFSLPINYLQVRV